MTSQLVYEDKSQEPQAGAASRRRFRTLAEVDQPEETPFHFISVHPEKISPMWSRQFWKKCLNTYKLSNTLVRNHTTFVYKWSTSDRHEIQGARHKISPVLSPIPELDCRLRSKLFQRWWSSSFYDDQLALLVPLDGPKFHPISALIFGNITQWRTSKHSTNLGSDWFKKKAKQSSSLACATPTKCSNVWIRTFRLYYYKLWFVRKTEMIEGRLPSISRFARRSTHFTLTTYCASRLQSPVVTTLLKGPQKISF